MATWKLTMDDLTFSVLAQKFGRPTEQVKVILLENAVGVERED